MQVVLLYVKKRMPEITDIPALLFLINFSQFVECGVCLKETCAHCTFLHRCFREYRGFFHLRFAPALICAILSNRKLQDRLKKMDLWVNQKDWGGWIILDRVEYFKMFYETLWNMFVKCAGCKYTSVPFDRNCPECIVVRDYIEFEDGCYDGTSMPHSWSMKDFEEYLEAMIRKLKS